MNWLKHFFSKQDLGVGKINNEVQGGSLHLPNYDLFHPCPSCPVSHWEELSGFLGVSVYICGLWGQTVASETGSERDLRSWRCLWSIFGLNYIALCPNNGDSDKHWPISICKMKTNNIIVKVSGNIFFFLFQFCNKRPSTQMGGMSTFSSYLLCFPQDTLGDFPKRLNRIKCSPLPLI